MHDKGETLGAPVDLADGYVHFSTAQQARETAAGKPRKHQAAEAQAAEGQDDDGLDLEQELENLLDAQLPQQDLQEYD